MKYKNTIPYIILQQGGNIKYTQTESQTEIPEIQGYKKQFSIQAPQGDVVEESKSPQVVYIQVPQQQQVQAEPQEEPTPVNTAKTSKKYTNKNEFISEMTEAYSKALKLRGINPDYASYLAIQDALESGFGKSYVGNWNYGNITVGSSGASYTEGKDHDGYGKQIINKFRNYDTLDDYINNKIDLLSGRRYRAFNGDISGFYSRVKAGGYAGDPNYVAHLNKLYGQYFPLKGKNGLKLPKFQNSGKIKAVINEKKEVPTGSWLTRVKKFIHPYGTENKLKYNYDNQIIDIEDQIQNTDYTNVSDMTNLVNKISKLKDWKTVHKDWKNKTDEYRGNYASSILPFFGKVNPNQNDLLAQLWRYYSRHKGHQSQMQENFTGKGTDIIDLDKNVIRLTPSSKQSTALFNEFVETRNPSVYPASEYQSGDIKNISDQNIPVKNINLYAGVEDGHYKVDSLKNFNPSTIIYPARNIKKNVLPIKKFNITDVENKIPKTVKKHMSSLASNANMINSWFPSRLFTHYYQYGDEPESINRYNDRKKYEHYRDSITNEINQALNENNLEKATELMYGEPQPYTESKWWMNEVNNNVSKDLDRRMLYGGYTPPELRAKSDSLENVANHMHKFLFPEKKHEKNYSYVDINNEEHPISDYNASILDSKIVFGNPTGGKFVGKIQDISKSQLDSLNNYLNEHPSWLVRPDLGSFSQYRLDGSDLQTYLQQYFEHPKADDPNVYTIGTTEPNKIWK